ncbi:MAG: protein kinase, partial [Planctomycetota bacterium]|nr:protein kinase [Planctomycetota bacterium]
MLSKRDKLIVKIASRLGLFKEEMMGPIALAKQKEPDKALDRLMRELDLINREEQRTLARAFNDYIEKKREKSGRQPGSKSKSSRRQKVPESNVENEATYVLDSKKPTPPSGLASPMENTYVMAENQPPSSGDPTFVLNDDSAGPNIENTIVLGQENLAKPKSNVQTATAAENTFVMPENKPPANPEATFVLQENRPAPPSAEMTIVLTDEDAIRKETPLEFENTFVLSENQTQAAPPPTLDIESTYVLKDEVRSAPKRPASPPSDDEDVTEFEQTLVMSDDSPKRSAPSVTEFEPTFVLKDEDPAPRVLESLTIPVPTARVSAEATEFEPTFVLQDEDAEVRRLPDPVLDAPRPPQEADFAEPTLLLDDSDEAPRRPAAAAQPSNPFAQSPDSSLLEVPMESEATYVLEEKPASPFGDSLDLNMGQGRTSGGPLTLRPDSEEIPVLSMPDEDSAMDLSIPDDLALGNNRQNIPVVQATPENEGKASSSSLDLGSLSLKSESSGSSRRSAMPTPGVKKRGGPLNRDVFKVLAKQRKSFKDYTIGDYHIQSEISRGAMGVVLRATPTGMAKTMAQARGFDGDVALKVMLENNADPKEAERFLEEMKILTKLNHPNIVRIFDCGREGGLSYFSMELLEGQDVRNMITKDGPPPFMLTLKIVSQIANALAFLHRSTVY